MEEQPQQPEPILYDMIEKEDDTIHPRLDHRLDVQLEQCLGDMKQYCSHNQLPILNHPQMYSIFNDFIK